MLLSGQVQGLGWYEIREEENAPATPKNRPKLNYLLAVYFLFLTHHIKISHMSPNLCIT